MNNELSIKQMHCNESNGLKKLWGLIRWSLIRHRYLIPSFSIVQAALAIAIVSGLALMIPDIDEQSSLYLSSGALTIGIIAVGCVLAPQIVSGTKQNGLFQYQRTLPIARISILLADILIWSIAALPGIIVSCLTAVLRFNVSVSITLFSTIVVLIVLITMICIGFAIAYWFPPNAMALVTQIIMIGGLLFSPITYPASRLPEWTLHIHQFLPLVPTSNLIRASLFQVGLFAIIDLCVVLLWAATAFTFALVALSRKE